MVVGRIGVGDQQGRPSDGGELGHRRGTGPGDHQMGLGEQGRDILEEAGEARGDAELGIGRADAVEVLRPALLGEHQPGPERSRQQRDGLRDEADLDEDHMEAVSQLLREMEDNLDDLDGVEPAQHHFRYDLCPECRKKFVRDPLGKDAAQKFDFSEN